SLNPTLVRRPSTSLTILIDARASAVPTASITLASTACRGLITLTTCGGAMAPLSVLRVIHQPAATTRTRTTEATMAFFITLSPEICAHGRTGRRARVRQYNRGFVQEM